MWLFEALRGVGEAAAESWWWWRKTAPLGEEMARPRGVAGDPPRRGESSSIASSGAGGGGGSVGNGGGCTVGWVTTDGDGADTLRCRVENRRASECRPPFLLVSVAMSSRSLGSGLARKASLSFRGTNAGVERLPFSNDWPMPKCRCDPERGRVVAQEVV